MTRFWREGHWRWGKYDRHWVEGHWVDRDGWSSTWAYTAITPSAQSTSTFARIGSSVDPHAQCPVCGAAVFFYSNESGSRVYFDDLGPPWPKHPCMDTSSPRVSVGGERAPLTEGLGSSIRNLSGLDETGYGVHIPGVFITLAVEKRGPKRVVSLQEIGGARIEILVSPPAPPVYAVAVSRGIELHWFDPSTGSRGRNLVWGSS
jgi:hypothetical protein